MAFNTAENITNCDEDEDSQSSSFISDFQENYVFKSEYASLYKCPKTSTMNQEQRRTELLELQKTRRLEIINEKRGLSQILNDDEENETLNEEEEEMIVDVHEKQRKKRRKFFSNKLMLSEWFTELPDDLESEWLVKLCPIGRRNLIVADNGITRVYTRSGTMKNEFKSNLPNGNEQNRRRQSCTILDCIYNPKTKFYFVLDVIAWNGVPQKYYPAEHRFFWIKSKLNETPLTEINANNRRAFLELESFPAELSVIEDRLSRPFSINNVEIPLDGVLFYHKRGLYRNGLTPLVGWLKPFMLPEFLHTPVHFSFMERKPGYYTNLQDFFGANKNNKAHQRRRNNKQNDDSSESMEVMN